MPFDFHRARPLLQTGDLTRLFVEELGWEPCRQKLTLRAGQTDYALTAIAQKRGFTVWLCPSPEGPLPGHTTRLKLDRALTQTSFEHLIVFATQEGGQQSWMWVRREPGRPLSPRTHEFNRAQPGDSLLQKLQILYVSLEEEEKGELSTVTMAGRARDAFDLERVTKAFYRDFDTHRKAFLKFIEGIDEVADREWYASVMLNRLMFVYFIQRKGFLDADPDYLRNRLRRCRQENGKDDFYRFYRYFLLRLFHEGFGKRRQDRAPDLERLLGNIPYLNGGLFDVHELEKPERYGQAIRIPDQAFERVFDYFDQYQWHLDERPLRADNEINPDVLGYIFEKYINQKQMGAYYTKEDITEYISKSTVIPFLFDAARAKCRVAFDGGPGFQPAGPAATSPARPVAKIPAPPPAKDACPTVWDLLRDHPDRYIYPAVRHGMDKPLPPEIAAGLDPSKPDLIERRKAWNKPAPGEYALPTEIWREVVARRQRYWEVWSRLSGRPANPVWVANPPRAAALSPSPPSAEIEGRWAGDSALRTPHSALNEVGESPLESVERSEIPTPRDTPHSAINEINDFITLNLDLRQFAQDVIHNSEGPDLLMAFWQAIATITVLDPTGGSGAFIFAALNILEPLYEACLDRMEAFLAEWRQSSEALAKEEAHKPKPLHPNYHKKFTEVLARVHAHPNRRYFVLKAIILNNLYAVDIMEEAVEICKLRLFLKLAAQVEPNTAKDNLGIEPLPDIDFNIRAGNTLVGYATYNEVKRAVTSTLDFDSAMEAIAVKAADLQQTFDKFRQLQTEGDCSAPAADKLELQKRLKALEDQLNRHLAGQYGVKVSDKADYVKWIKSHQPFHWFIQFYGILRAGGFDVIIGNPPYVNAAKVRAQYRVKNLATLDCPDIYAWVLERAHALLRDIGRSGMIVPLSLGFSSDFDACRQMLFKGYSANWFSSFGRIPSALFNFDVRVRNTIHIGSKARGGSSNHTTRLHRWFDAARPVLFHGLTYAPFQPKLWKGRIPKLNTPRLAAAFEQLLHSTTHTLDFFTSPRATKHVLHFKKTAYNWLNFCRTLPPCYDERGREVSHTQFGEIYFSSGTTRDTAMLLADGKLMFVYWCAVGDDFHVAGWNFGDFPIDLTRFEGSQNGLARLVEELESAMGSAKQFKLNAGRNVGNYNLAKCRHVTDRTDGLFLGPLRMEAVLDDLDLYCAQVVKTDFDAQED